MKIDSTNPGIDVVVISGVCGAAVWMCSEELEDVEHHIHTYCIHSLAINQNHSKTYTQYYIIYSTGPGSVVRRSRRDAAATLRYPNSKIPIRQWDPL